MKILYYFLSISVLLITFSGNSQTLGPGEDPFYECKPSPTGDVERQENKVKFLEDAEKVNSERVKNKEQELAQAKEELRIASLRVQNTDSTSRDSSAMDEKQRAIEKVDSINNELVTLRRSQGVNAELLKNAQITLNAQKERDKLTNSSIEIFTLTTAELAKNSVPGSIADTNLQLMALATSGANHLECNPSSDTDAPSYHIFKAASAAYLTNNLSEIMDYENLAECVTKKALNPNEKKDVQYALIKRARDLFNEMEKHVSSVMDSRSSDLEFFSKALEYSGKEWAAKNQRVGTAFAAYTTAIENEKDAYNWWLGVMIAAIVMSALAWVPFFGAYAALVAIALWAFWGASLVPKLAEARRVLSEAKTELAKAHKHTSLACNYSDAKRWDLAIELNTFDRYLDAKLKAKKAELAEEEERRRIYKEQQYQNEKEERNQSKEKSSYLFLKPQYLLSNKNWTDFFMDKLIAQDQVILENAINKIQDAYTKSTSTEPMVGSIASQGDAKSRIPAFTPGTPEGNRVVEDLRRQFEAKKQAYVAKKTEVDVMYDRLEALMKDYNDYASKFGEVATGNPEIKCTYEWPFPYYRAVASGSSPTYNWDNTADGRAWANTWRTRGCTTDNKRNLETKQSALSSYYDVISPHDAILSALELSMDQAELDYLTALQINENADSSDPFNPTLTPGSREAAAFADFLGKIKAEWKTSSIDTEKNNFILVDRTTSWTLEKLLNEHTEIKALPADKKAGFSDPYTRYIYMQYAVDLIIKNLDLLNRAHSLALGQAMAYQELLNDADVKLGLDAVALPDVSLRLAKNKSCMKNKSGGYQADPTCSCKARGNCSKFSFPTAVLHKGSDQGSGVIENYANDVFSGSEGARLSGTSVKRNAAATKTSIEETKTSIIQQRKDMGFQNTNIENNSNLLGAAISAESRRAAASALSSNTKTGRVARILALEKKTTPLAVQSAIAAATKPKTVIKMPKSKKEAIKMGLLSIDEEGTATEGEVQDSFDLGLTTSAKEENAQAKTPVGEKGPGVEYDPSKTLWKIITKRYQRSAFPKLLKKKKVE